MNSSNTYLVLYPEELTKAQPFLGFIKVTKEPKSTRFDYVEFNRSQFVHLPQAIKPKAAAFLHTYYTEAIQEFKKQHQRLKSGTSAEQYIQRAAFRYLHEHTIDLRQTLHGLKIYHRVKVISGNNGYNFRVEPCAFSDIVPSMSFEVIADETSGLLLKATFLIGEERISGDAFKRYGFLLLKDNVYFQLHLSDFHTLDWLREQQPQQYAHHPSHLLRNIILKLEEKYTVNRNNHFPVHNIRCTPENTILLSEINDAFLLLTPRWKYDDITVEGNFKPIYETQINGELYAIERDKSAEAAFMQYLRSMHPSFQRQINGVFYVSFEEAKKKQWFLKAYHEWLDQNIEIHGMDLLHHFRYSPFAIETNIQLIKQEGSLLTLEMKVRFGKEEASLNELRKLLLAGQQYILLKDNSMGVLTPEWIKAYGTLLKHGKIHQQTVVVPQWIMLVLNNSGEEQPAWQKIFSKDWWQQWEKWQTEEDHIISLPEGLNATLRPYQQKGFEWLVLLSQIGAGACLADDMGLGKTLQTIAFLLHQANENPQARFLIACPASLMMNWQREIEKFAPNLSVQLYYQAQRKIDYYFEQGVQVLITSYGTLRSDIEELSLIPWDVAILDESHHIKNHSTQISQAVVKLNARNRIALSGTPVMNHTEELYPQLNFLLPSLLGSLEFFRKEYAYPIDRHRDLLKIKALQRLTQPFILRRTKAQVASDLPEKIESILWCEMGADQKACYQDVLSAIRSSVFLGMKEQGINKARFSILQGIQKLRQICAAPQLVKDLEYPCFESIKLEVMMEELVKLGQHKALVFSQFREMLHMIAEKCRNEGMLYYHFDGTTKIQERQRMVEEFQDPDNDIGIFLISLMTGNAGLNLTAADYVFLVDPWWNTAVQHQAIDRTHRIGQQKTVFAYKMICKDTIEERILQLQQRKQNISDDLIQEEDGFVKQLTEEDVAFLFM